MTSIILTLDYHIIKHHSNTIACAIDNFNEISSFLDELKESVQLKDEQINEIMDIIRSIEKINDDLIKENEYLITKLKGVSYE